MLPSHCLCAITSAFVVCETLSARVKRSSSFQFMGNALGSCETLLVTMTYFMTLSAPPELIVLDVIHSKYHSKSLNNESKKIQQCILSLITPVSVQFNKLIIDNSACDLINERSVSDY